MVNRSIRCVIIIALFSLRMETENRCFHGKAESVEVYTNIIHIYSEVFFLMINEEHKLCQYTNPKRNR